MPSTTTARLVPRFTFVAALGATTPAAGQSPDRLEYAQGHDAEAAKGINSQSKLIDEISGNLTVGPGWFEAGELEDRLRAHGFDDVDTLGVLVGVSARVIFDVGLTLGASAAMFGRDAVQGPNAYEARSSYNMLRAEAGYALLHSPRWLLVPKLTLGGYSATLNLSDDRDATFDELLDAPGTTTSVSSGSMLMGALLDFAVRLAPGRADAGARGFLSVGLEGGYLYSVPFTRWHSNSGGEVDDGPDAPFTGAFVGLTVGGGAYDL